MVDKNSTIWASLIELSLEYYFFTPTIPSYWFNSLENVSQTTIIFILGLESCYYVFPELRTDFLEYS